MPKFLKVKIFAADRIIYQGKAAAISLRFFHGHLEVMCQRKEFFASFDRGTITVSYSGDIVEYDLNLGFASSTGAELTVLAAKAKKVTPESGYGECRRPKEKDKICGLFPNRCVVGSHQSTDTRSTISLNLCMAKI